MRTSAHRQPAAPGFRFRVNFYKRRKFGQGHASWLAFEAWGQEILGRPCSVNELSDSDAELIVSRLKQLPDAPVEGQETLEFGG